MLKKVLCFCLTVFMLFTSICVSHAETEVSSPEKLTEQEGLINALGIINMSIVDREAVITRSQFAKYLWKALALTALQESEKKFLDVESNNEITYLASYGYFVGEGEMFYPERNMTISEAYIVALRVLGYDVHADALGGTSASYDKISKRIKLNNDVNESEGLTVKNAAIILGNMLLVNVYDVEKISNNITEYTNKGTENLLERIYDVKAVEGIVSATSFATIYDNIDKCGDNSICVNKDEYLCELNHSDELLGREVVAYYRTENGRDSIFYVYTDDKLDETIEIPAEDFLDYSNNRITYQLDGRKRSVNIEEQAVFIRNGKSMIGATKAEKNNALKISSGSVKLYKSGKDAYYTVTINNFGNAVITNYDSVKNEIYAEKSDGLVVKFSPDNADFFEVYDFKSGIKQDLSALKRGIFVSYLLSDDGKYAKLYLNEEVVTGEIQSISENGGIVEVSVGDKVYKVNQDFKNDASVKLGVTSAFYLDIFGYIAYEANAQRASLGNLAYCYDIAKSTKGLEKSVEIKVYTSKGELKILTIAEKCELDSIPLKSADDVYEKLTDEFGSIKRQIIRYSANADDKVIKIDTAAADEASCDDEMTLYLQAAKGERRYTRDDITGMYVFGANSEDINKMGYMLDANTVIFHVSNFDEPITSEKEKTFSVETVSGMYAKNIFNVELYAESKGSPFATAAVIDDSYYSSSTSKLIEPYVINSITRAYDEDGDYTKISVLSSKDNAVQHIRVYDYVYLELSEGNEIRVKADEVQNYLSPGDVLRFGDRKRINQVKDSAYRYITVLYDYSEDKTYWSTPEEPYKYDYSITQDGVRYSMGYVDSLYIQTALLATESVATVITISDYDHNVIEIAAPKTSFARLTFFDETRRGYDLAYKGTPGDIVDYKSGVDDASKIFVYWQGSTSYGYVIYK